jgi:hypothetical protein
MRNWTDGGRRRQEGKGCIVRISISASGEFHMDYLRVWGFDTVE